MSFKLAASVAQYAEVLRGSPYAKTTRYQDILSVAQQVANTSTDPKITEFTTLVQQASFLNLSQP